MPVDRAALAEHLGRFGPLRIGAAPAAEHDLICELWTVCNGRATPGGLDLGETAVSWAGAAAGLSGLWWGAGLGWLAGVASKGDIGHAVQAGARTGFEGTTALVTQQLRDVNRAVSLGPYHELMLAVPDVCVGDDDTPHMAVLAMATDSQLALAIDTSFGYGYAKRRAAFEVNEPGSWSVSVLGDTWVQARLSVGPHRAEHLDCVNRWWSQPLLGGLDAGRWVSSRLERPVEAPSAAWVSLTGNVQLSSAALPHTGAGSHRVGDAGVAFAFRELPSRISYPRPL